MQFLFYTRILRHLNNWWSLVTCASFFLQVSEQFLIYLIGKLSIARVISDQPVQCLSNLLWSNLIGLLLLIPLQESLLGHNKNDASLLGRSGQSRCNFYNIIDNVTDATNLTVLRAYIKMKVYVVDRDHFSLLQVQILKTLRDLSPLIVLD